MVLTSMPRIAMAIQLCITMLKEEMLPNSKEFWVSSQTPILLIKKEEPLCILLSITVCLKICLKLKAYSWEIMPMLMQLMILEELPYIMPLSSSQALIKLTIKTIATITTTTGLISRILLKVFPVCVATRILILILEVFFEFWLINRLR